MIDKDYRFFATRMGELYKMTYDVEIRLGRTHEQADKFTKKIIAGMLHSETMPEVFVLDVSDDDKKAEEEARARLISKFSKKWDMPMDELEETVDIMISSAREAEKEFDETA